MNVRPDTLVVEKTKEKKKKVLKLMFYILSVFELEISTIKPDKPY